MKTKEEIEQLAREEYKDYLQNPFFTAAPMGYVKGYEQCQKDIYKQKFRDEMEKTIEEIRTNFIDKNPE